jgi:hypothetical protein
MKHVFYFFAIAAITWEAVCFLNPKKVSDFIKRTKESLSNGLSDFSMTQTAFTFLSFGYLAWTLVGLFSSQWVLFLALMLLGFIPKRFVWYRAFDAFVSFVILLFIVLNAYHFKIDVWHWIVNR